MPAPVLMLSQFTIGVYGGYFGGGIGFLMLAALTLAGQAPRMATATKNMLAMAMNASAFAMFMFSPQVHWIAAAALAAGGIAGGFAGNWLLHRLPERRLRAAVVVIGVVLTVWLFIK